MEAEKLSEWKLGQSSRSWREETERLGQICSSSSPARPNSGEAELGLWFGESVGEGEGEPAGGNKTGEGGSGGWGGGGGGGGGGGREEEGEGRGPSFG